MEFDGLSNRVIGCACRTSREMISWRHRATEKNANVSAALVVSVSLCLHESQIASNNKSFNASW
jgi:hypothetical protein